MIINDVGYSNFDINVLLSTAGMTYRTIEYRTVILHTLYYLRLVQKTVLENLKT